MMRLVAIGEAEEESWEHEGEWEVRAPRRWWGWAAFFLSLAGFVDALYLTIDHFQGTIPICSASGVVDCAKVTTSPQSEVFGIFPVALLGLIFYTVQIGINVPPLWRLRGDIGRWVSYARLALVLTGMGMVLYLVYTELFTINAICLWCTGVHAVSFVLFVLVVITFPAMVRYSDDSVGV
jgi:uncharacterized membrane protein